MQAVGRRTVIYISKFNTWNHVTRNGGKEREPRPTGRVKEGFVDDVI